MNFAEIAAALPNADMAAKALEAILDDRPYLAGEAISLADLHAAPMFGYFEQAPEGAGKILLRAGRVTKALTVDQVLAAENANITPIPEVIDRPDWLVGVIVSQEAEVCLCVVPV